MVIFVLNSLPELHRINFQPPETLRVVPLYLPQAVYYAAAHAAVVYFDGYRAVEFVPLYQLLSQQDNVVRRFHGVLPLSFPVKCHLFVYLVPDYRLVVSKTSNVAPDMH